MKCIYKEQCIYFHSIGSYDIFKVTSILEHGILCKNDMYNIVGKSDSTGFGLNLNNLVSVSFGKIGFNYMPPLIFVISGRFFVNDIVDSTTIAQQRSEDKNAYMPRLECFCTNVPRKAIIGVVIHSEKLNVPF